MNPSFIIPMVMSFFCGIVVVLFSILIIENLPSRQSSANPFTRIGSITTNNGVVGEVFRVEKHPCYVLVQVSAPELGRNYMQLECK